MKDRIYMVLGFIGFVIIAVVVTLNYSGNGNTYYEVGSSYTPTQRSDLVSAAEIYNQITGARALTCPCVALSGSEDSLVTLTSIWGSYHDHPYSLNNLFVTQTPLELSGSSNRPTVSNYIDLLHLSDVAKNPNKALMKDLFTVDIFSDGYVEIVSPFGFQFGNINSDVRKSDDDTNETVQDIVITNVKGNCRITFGNVVNWFCAGEVGTEGIKSNMSDGVVPWVSHSKAHHSVIGNSPNSVVKGGNSGVVIGYADRNTTVLIEVFENGSFKKASLSELIVPPSFN